MTKYPESTSQPSAPWTILYGGMAVGVLDAIDAMTFFWLYAGAAPMRIWGGRL